MRQFDHEKSPANRWTEETAPAVNVERVQRSLPPQHPLLQPLRSELQLVHGVAGLHGPSEVGTGGSVSDSVLSSNV